MTRDLLNTPLCAAEDLGRPVPDSPHAVSVCLPRWQDVVDYEEQAPRVLQAMEAGYPRFFMMPQVVQAQSRVLESQGEAGEECLLFPSLRAAERCRQFAGNGGRVREVGGFGAFFHPASLRDVAWQYRRHSGDIPSSRQAEAFLREDPGCADIQTGEVIKERLSAWTGQPPDHHFLYGNGMKACFHLHRALARVFPRDSCVQFGFPYVDVLKIQEKFPPGSTFIEDLSASGLEKLRGLVATGKVSAVFTELPTNPLLRSPDLSKLAVCCREWDVPLVVDDTIGGWTNTDVLQWADVSWSSLTKLFSGRSDVMGGAVVVNRESRLAERILGALHDEGESGLFSGDLDVLEQNSGDYPRRVSQTNQNALELVHFLQEHPKVDRVYYPANEDREAFDRVRRPEGGYGCLLSLMLKDAGRVSPGFYDTLKVTKGPSLGTNFTLVCPFTLLAHYHELDWAESCGVSRWLIRVSVGLEEPQDLIQRFAEALDSI
jgi:cystathionine gamma-synthase